MTSYVVSRTGPEERAAPRRGPAGRASADPVVMGVDDGLLRVRVLDRAVREARRRGSGLVLVHTHGPETPLAVWYDDAGRRAEAYLARTAPELPVSRLCRAGNPTDTLVGSCGPGSLLILGDRHRRMGTEAGRITERAVAEAPCPVLVVPEYRGPTPRGAVVRRAVVVGVDDGPAATPVLRHALRIAAELGSPLEAVRVVAPAPTAEPAAVDRSETTILARAARDLDALVARAHEVAPEVRVSTEVVLDRPARALLDRAAGADELVVGHRRRAAVTLRGPGSTARSVLMGAPCAVTVLGPAALACTDGTT